MTGEDLIGRVMEYHYAPESCRIGVLTEARVRWTRTRGDAIGTSDEEALEHFTALTDHAPDFAEGTVTAHANMGREVFRNPGRLTLSD